MKFCCTLGFVHTDHLVELAMLAEEVGFDTVTVPDHVVHPIEIRSRYPYTPTGERSWDSATPWADPWVAIMAMAAHTRKLRFSQGVYILPMRDPFSVAKATGTCARLSGNRVSLGIGLGWMKEEFEILGHPFEERGARTDEMVAVLKKLWTGQTVEHHGRFYDFDPLIMAPGIDREIPIIVGGWSPAAMRRVARLGDGWAPAGLSVEQVRTAMNDIRQQMKEYGRADHELEIFAACPDAQDLDGYRRMEEAEISHLVVKPWTLYSEIDSTSIAPLESMKDSLKRFGDEVIAAF